MPVCANAACFENTLSYFGQSERLGISVCMLIKGSGYSAIVNLLDFTAVTFPVVLTDKDMDPKLDSLFAPVSKEDEATHQSCTHTHFVLFRLEVTNILPVADDPKAFHGAPVGLQLMCRRTEEETALKLVEMILQAQAQTLPSFG